ncbi:dethiobiotin synthase [Thioclava nitratireducens]|uniref:ATP-dependent dethiobiotin synthetase BioD n=1 Tax=Thioclava nitratireducens TaxID=1915078 RepID=A0ABN4X7Q7_9RHOB|nr:dethiobiotin synthase [Thioclava nitratireducens]AQS47117.1 dethiobiotin synthase [Thioclava nitratireducens]
MTSPIVVTGTDTGIGKTVFSAALTLTLQASYWKPVQAGLDEETDSETVARLTGRPTLPEAWRLRTPASPHLAARLDRVEIGSLELPEVKGPLVIEGAGGALVPLNGNRLYADQMADWGAPVIVVARTTLGTINHSLLTIEALRARGVPLVGIAFVGDEVADSQDTICRIAELPSLGRLPVMSDLTTQGLRDAARRLDLDRIRGAL